MEGARAATEADLPRLVELSRQSLSELRSQDRGGAVFVAREGRAEPVETSLREQVLDPGCLVIAGTIDEVVVGYATGRVETLRDGTLLGVIDDLFVEPEARAVGVGEAMMEQLLAWFRQRGCSGVDSTALPGLRATKNFFEESGFSARLIVMHHRMRPA